MSYRRDSYEVRETVAEAREQWEADYKRELDRRAKDDAEWAGTVRYFKLIVAGFAATLFALRSCVVHEREEAEKAALLKVMPTREYPLQWARPDSATGLPRCQGVAWAEFQNDQCVCKHTQTGDCAGLDTWIKSLCECEKLK